MSYQHLVQVVIDPGDATGFMYTVGMPRQELFALDVPRACVKDVFGLMNHLSERCLSPGEGAQSGDKTPFHLRRLKGKRRKELMKTHLCRMEPTSVVLELCPIHGWPEKELDTANDPTCLPCCECGKCCA